MATRSCSAPARRSRSTATLNKSLPYDPAKDFAPIALVSNAPFLLLVHPSQPVHSVVDLVALAKSKPGQLSYGSAGAGLAAAPELRAAQDVDRHRTSCMCPIAVTDRRSPISLPGTSRRMFGEPTPILPLLRDGKVRALGGVVGVAAADRA